MHELTQNELDEVNGGIQLIVVVAVVSVTGAFCLGVYNGYQEAKREALKK